MEHLPDDMIGQEFDWFAVDKDGHVGHFSSAGYGPIPETAVLEKDLHVAILQFFLQQQGGSSVKLLKDDQGDYSDWMRVASHGIFSYDFKHWDGPYVLLALPLQPVMVSSLPEFMQNSLLKISFSVLCFQSNHTVTPTTDGGDIRWVS